MVAPTTVSEQPSANPFRTEHQFSSDAVDLMRALSQHRIENAIEEATPQQILQVVADLGYECLATRQLKPIQQVQRFVAGIARHQRLKNSSRVSCEDLLEVLNSLGYEKATPQASDDGTGLPVDRRRREMDIRLQKTERRSDLSPSPQEELELTPLENQFLDRLKTLRTNTGRQFGSSEELLSIAWDLGLRPANDDGTPATTLSEDQKCDLQIAFTRAIETRLLNAQDDEFLTIRDVIEKVEELGFHAADLG